MGGRGRQEGHTAADLAKQNGHAAVANLLEKGGPTFNLTAARLSVTATPAPSPAVSGLSPVCSYALCAQSPASSVVSGLAQVCSYALGAPWAAA